jgi:hyperosmotically inducible protein
MMLNFKPLGRTLLLGTLCTAFFGCTETTTTSTRTSPSADRDVTVTARKPVFPNDQTSPNTTGVDRTNTEVNVRDRDDLTKTPLDQNENKADIKITADIRSRVVDTEMSIDAQNVKIITQDGKVTLRGPVHTATEKATIEQIATDVAGKDNVDSQLEIDAN